MPEYKYSHVSLCVCATMLSMSLGNRFCANLWHCLHYLSVVFRGLGVWPQYFVYIAFYLPYRFFVVCVQCFGFVFVLFLCCICAGFIRQFCC